MARGEKLCDENEKEEEKDEYKEEEENEKEGEKDGYGSVGVNFLN